MTTTTDQGTPPPNSLETGLRVQVLGPIRVLHGPCEPNLGPGMQRAVLAVLAANHGKPVSLRELVTSLWGDSPPASADGSVYTYISGLRRCLGAAANALVSQSAGYRLSLPRGALDAAEFDRLRILAEDRVAAGDSAEALRHVNAALDLWRGEAYSGVPGPFAEAERDRLAAQWLAVRERRAACMLDLGDHADVVADLLVLTREHPLQESLRVLLMLALDRNGRHAEALEVFHDSRRVLRAELGIEPGPELCRTHDRLLAGEPALAAPDMSSALVAEPRRSLPTRIAQAESATVDSPALIGRTAELATLRGLLAGVAAGTGHSLWVEGPAGIGKSEIVTAAFAGAGRAGCELGWAVADQLGGRLPLQVMVDCLDIDMRSADPRRAALARRMAGQGSRTSPGGLVDADPVGTAVEGLLALVDELCATAPLVLVIDDIQWADDASLRVWHRLAAATRQIPLLLVATSRPAPNRVDLMRLRQGVESRGHTALVVPPLGRDESHALVGRLVGAAPGPGLCLLADQAAGNPLLLCGTMEPLVRSGAVSVTEAVAELSGDVDWQMPTSLTVAVDRTLAELTEPTHELLRWAAVLGLDFTVDDLAAVLGCTASEVTPMVEEAVAAAVLHAAGASLGFRHPLLREVLYAGVPGPARSVLRRRVAEQLAEAGAPVRRVAEQLLSAASVVDGWVGGWLVEHGRELANQAPAVAADLLERVLAARSLGRDHREVLTAELARVLTVLDRDAEEQTHRAIQLARDPALGAEMRQLLAGTLHRRGEVEWAEEVLLDALAVPGVPALWRARHRALLANVRRGEMVDLDTASERALAMYDAAAGSDDVYTQAHALQVLWQVDSMRRDHPSALRRVEEAIDVVGDRPELVDLRFDLLDNRIFTLENLDRLHEANLALRSAQTATAELGIGGGLRVSAAVHHYWAGRWDPAMIELDAIAEDREVVAYHGLRESRPAMMLLHGIAALISCRREDLSTAAVHLDAADSYLPATRPERECYDFLLAAQAVAAEQRGELRYALDLLAPVLSPSYARMMLRHQWLPDIVRLALEAGDSAMAKEALDACTDEAAAEALPARASAALHRCRALVDGDAGAARVAADHYAKVGRFVELAAALEDLAVLHATAGRADDALDALRQCARLYLDLGARWDLRRADRRLAPLGVRREFPLDEGKAERGWSALTPIEIRIAALVAQGRSNPEIASELLTPRRTVQAQIDRILRKLGVQSRAEITEKVQSNIAATPRIFAPRGRLESHDFVLR